MAWAGPAVISSDSIDGQYPPEGPSPASGHSLGFSSGTWNGKKVTIQRVVDEEAIHRAFHSFSWYTFLLVYLRQVLWRIERKKLISARTCMKNSIIDNILTQNDTINCTGDPYLMLT